MSLYITGSVLVQANQFFGAPLACEGVSRYIFIFDIVLCDLLIVSQGEDTVDEEAIANYCMMYSVFLVPDNYLVIGLVFQLITNVTNPRVSAPVMPMRELLFITVTISGSHSSLSSRSSHKFCFISIPKYED